MSDNQKGNNEVSNLEISETPQKEVSRPIEDRIQYLIGAVSGIITVVAIYLSGRDLGVTDQLIGKIIEYSFLIAFAAFMLGIRKIEADRNINMKKTRTTYIIAISVGIVIFFIMALTP